MSARLPVVTVAADKTIRLLTLEELLAAAGRVLAQPHANAVRVSINETVSFAVLARQADTIARRAAALVEATRAGDNAGVAASLPALAADLEITGHLAPAGAQPSSDRKDDDRG